MDKNKSGVLELENIADSMKGLGVDKKNDEIEAMLKVRVRICAGIHVCDLAHICVRACVRAFSNV